MESLSGSEANPSSEQGMTGGMLDYDNDFNEMLTADAKRRTCRPTAASLIRFLILAPTAAHWMFLFWSLGYGFIITHGIGDAFLTVTDSHDGIHKIHIDRTHAFVVSTHRVSHHQHLRRAGR